MFVLGGEVAVPAGECASEASRGLDSTGVTGATYGPGSAHGAVAVGVGISLAAALRLLRYMSAARSRARQVLYAETLSSQAALAAVWPAWAFAASDCGGSLP